MLFRGPLQSEGKRVELNSKRALSYFSVNSRALSNTESHFVLQGFVLAVTITREAIDEFRRFRRDKEVNSQLYSKLTVRG